MRIVIDAGHGGKDPGAVGNGLREKDLTLALALKIGQLLAYHGVDVIYTRDTDVFVELSDRAKIANQASADYFVSVHINATGTGLASGFESYVYPGSAADVRDVLHNHIAALYQQAGFADRGKREANYAVLRETNMPAVLLEYGFIDNVRDAEKLADPAWLDALAGVTAAGLAAAFGLSDAPQEGLSDIDGHWASDAIKAVNDAGIMTGYEDGTFRPDKSVTRAELAKVVNDLLYLINRN